MGEVGAAWGKVGRGDCDGAEAGLRDDSQRLRYEVVHDLVLDPSPHRNRYSVALLVAVVGLIRGVTWKYKSLVMSQSVTVKEYYVCVVLSVCVAKVKFASVP